MQHQIKIIQLMLFLLAISYGNLSLASKAETIINLVKKGAEKIDDIGGAVGKSGSAQLDNASASTFLHPNKSISLQAVPDDISFWQTTAGVNVIKKLTECVSNRLSVYPAQTQIQAYEACKQAYISCKTNKKMPEDQCVAEVNQKPNFLVRPREDFWNPKLDKNVFKGAN